MKENSKALNRRLSDPAFLTKYFVGDGIDIGGAPDPLALYAHLFPLCKQVTTWDIGDGDAQFMPGVADDTYDFVYSSHCLEHIRDPASALKNWIRILRPGGHLIATVPEEDLYEQGVWPPTFNRDHKTTFSIGKIQSWSPVHVSMWDLLGQFRHQVKILKVEEIARTYAFIAERFDHTLTPVTESAIEFICRKLTRQELDSHAHSRYQRMPLEKSLRKYYRQYQIDQRTLKAHAEAQGVFKDSNLE